MGWRWRVLAQVDGHVDELEVVQSGSGLLGPAELEKKVALQMVIARSGMPGQPEHDARCLKQGESQVEGCAQQDLKIGSALADAKQDDVQQAHGTPGAMQQFVPEDEQQIDLQDVLEANRLQCEVHGKETARQQPESWLTARGCLPEEVKTDIKTLPECIKAGNADTAKELLQSAENPDFKDEKGMPALLTPLDYAPPKEVPLRWEMQLPGGVQENDDSKYGAHRFEHMHDMGQGESEKCFLDTSDSQSKFADPAVFRHDNLLSNVRQNQTVLMKVEGETLKFGQSQPSLVRSENENLHTSVRDPGSYEPAVLESPSQECLSWIAPKRAIYSGFENGESVLVSLKTPCGDENASVEHGKENVNPSRMIHGAKILHAPKLVFGDEVEIPEDMQEQVFGHFVPLMYQKFEAMSTGERSVLVTVTYLGFEIQVLLEAEVMEFVRVEKIAVVTSLKRTMSQNKMVEIGNDTCTILNSPDGMGSEKEEVIPLLAPEEVDSFSLWGGVWSPTNIEDISFESDKDVVPDVYILRMKVFVCRSSVGKLVEYQPPILLSRLMIVPDSCLETPVSSNGGHVHAGYSSANGCAEKFSGFEGGNEALWRVQPLPCNQGCHWRGRGRYVDGEIWEYAERLEDRCAEELEGMHSQLEEIQAAEAEIWGYTEEVERICKECVNQMAENASQDHDAWVRMGEFLNQDVDDIRTRVQERDIWTNQQFREVRRKVENNNFDMGQWEARLEERLRETTDTWDFIWRLHQQELREVRDMVVQKTKGLEETH